jgi:hypothetical protein
MAAAGGGRRRARSARIPRMKEIEQRVKVGAGGARRRARSARIPRDASKKDKKENVMCQKWQKLEKCHGDSCRPSLQGAYFFFFPVSVSFFVLLE